MRVIPVILGGDHSIASADVAGIARHRGMGKISMIHFDAHADTGEPWVAQEVMTSLQRKVRAKLGDQEKVKLAEEIVNKVCIELNKAGRSAATTGNKWLTAVNE